MYAAQINDKVTIDEHPNIIVARERQDLRPCGDIGKLRRKFGCEVKVVSPSLISQQLVINRKEVIVAVGVDAVALLCHGNRETCRTIHREVVVVPCAEGGRTCDRRIGRASASKFVRVKLAIMSLSLLRPLFLALQQDFNGLTDPRVPRTRLHRLSDILLLSLAAFCCGAEGFEDIQTWSLAYGTENLQTVLGVRLENGVPHHDTFRRVLARISPQHLEESLHTLRQQRPRPDGESPTAGTHIAIDGKEIRGSHNAAQGTDAFALLSVFATDLNLVIGQRKVDSKTNEIPVAQEILKTLEIEGATVTADALHCQIKTAEAIRERKADYLLAVKDNRKGLHDAMKSLFRVNREEQRIPQTTNRQVEKGHGRLEIREGTLIRVSDWLEGDDPLQVWPDWSHVLCIECERRWTHRGQAKESRFTRYFISSSAADVARQMGFARSHWKIENGLHWLMDVTFGEDACRIRTGHEVQNVATLRRMAAFLLKATESEETKGMSLRKRRKWAGWRLDYLQKVITN